MKNCKWLKIEGKRVKDGTKYWTVSALSNEDGDFPMREQIAGNENNTIHLCYFFKEQDALNYRGMSRLLKTLSEEVIRIEKIHAIR